MAKNVLKNPRWALYITANVASAVASRNPKAVLWTLTEVIKFYHTGKGLSRKNCSILCHLTGTKNTKTIPICTTRKQLFRAQLRKEIEWCN